jgi:acetyltransferase
MTTRNLEHLFRPSSIAVIGASTEEDHIGALVLRNLVDSGYPGKLLAVNPKHDRIGAVICHRRIADLELAPELAVVCTPARTIPSIVAELGERGTKAAIVCSEGFGLPGSTEEQGLRKAAMAAARPHLLRILGPDSLGLLVPGKQLNASFAPVGAVPGRIAFVSQSSALTSGMLDWAHTSQVGFSHVVSLGGSCDVDVADVIDYLGSDPTAKAILLYIESTGSGRKFLSAARAASRNKPVVVVKAARSPEGVAAAQARGVRMVGSDAVFEAAVRRAGMLRVDSILDLVSSVQTLARARPLRGNRLTIICNGIGPAVVAADALAGGDAQLARLSAETRRRLEELVPGANWGENPISIPGNATADTWAKVLEAVLGEPLSDAVLLIHVPDARMPGEAVARACVPIVSAAERSVLACWLGGEAARGPRGLFAEAEIPCYETPDAAAQAFLAMLTYRRNRETLLQTPPSQPADFAPDISQARSLVEEALAAKRMVLSEPHAQALIATYDIPVPATRVAKTAKAAVALAEEFGYPVALKVNAPGLTRKSDIGGVVLNVDSAASVRHAIRQMRKRLRQTRTGTKPSGFVVQPMAHTEGTTQIFVGMNVDPMFGPVILFGEGGTAAELTGERAVALPPLNMALARELVSRSKVAKLLAGYRDRPAANLDAICLMLTKVAQLIIDLPQIVSLEMNPLLVDDKGVLALDVHIHITPSRIRGAQRLAILPYPKELEERAEFQGRRILLRPIRPEDEPEFHVFLGRMTAEDLRFRFFHSVREFTHSQLARLTQIDYSREMAFVAVPEPDGSAPEILGKVRAVFDPDNVSAEFGVTVRSDLQDRGLGQTLLGKLLTYCRERGISEIRGDVLAGNERMLRLAQFLGFSIDWSGGTGSAVVRLPASKVEAALKTLAEARAARALAPAPDRAAAGSPSASP